MPPLQVGGKHLPLSSDDFTAIMMPVTFGDVLSLLLVTHRAVRGFCSSIFVARWITDVDEALLVLMVVLNMVIAILSAQGNIMEERRHPVILKWTVIFRLSLWVPCILFCIWIWFRFVISWWTNTFQQPGDITGWGFNIVTGRGLLWLRALFLMLILFRCVMMLNSFLIAAQIVLPADPRARFGEKFMKHMFHCIGMKAELLHNCQRVLFDVFDAGLKSILAPTDAFWGLLLVAGRQHQGPFAPLLSEEIVAFETDTDDDTSANEDENSIGVRELLVHESLAPRCGMSTMTVRATTLTGVKKKPVPLLSHVVEDVEALRQITHYLPFAVGMYGISLEVLTNSVHPHTSIVSPVRFCRAVRNACPWHQPRVNGCQANVEGDCCKLNENALRRCLRDGAAREAATEPTLLWATWTNLGPSTSPPISISLDHSRRQVVIAFRGTMDIKDCLADLGAAPTFFDPLGESGPNDQRKPPFDDTGFFAHETMVLCSEDALERIFEEGVLASVFGPGGNAAGWGIMVVGHSLGAGVACLVALMLMGSHRSRAGIGPTTVVRYIGFEPPGGLLSKRLSDRTSELGFMITACANDLIPRLSVRAVQTLREDMLDELKECDRNKFQLFLLVLSRVFRRLYVCCCFRMPLFRLFQSLGGGRLTFSQIASTEHRGSRRTRWSLLRCEKGLSTKPPKFFEALWPPSKVVYFRPVEGQPWFCNHYEVCSKWAAEWAQPEDLHEIIVSPKSAEFHFPNIIRDAYFSAAVRAGAVDPSSFSELDTTSGSDSEC
eukprot:TRINITY_DN8514_c0_g2_i1.p1 TRINITY_DN8514_c0_g2~~TRINITY_DN8514_c0_g2_i1.p1  ORF type:complete len:789 (-),score=92.91 TRINITY_DN8514_c0_g2_i1:41-2368(-)